MGGKATAKAWSSSSLFGFRTIQQRIVDDSLSSMVTCVYLETNTERAVHAVLKEGLKHKPRG